MRLLTDQELCEELFEMRDDYKAALEATEAGNAAGWFMERTRRRLDAVNQLLETTRERVHGAQIGG